MNTFDETMDAEETLENPFADFDVAESDEEFLLSVLDAAPVEEREALSGRTESTSMVLPEPYIMPAQRSTVETFARTHPCWSSGKQLSADERRHSADSKIALFTQDIYDYARKAGLGQNQANVEVMRAIAAWRKETGLGRGEVLDGWHEDSYAETSCAIPISTRTSAASIVSPEVAISRTTKKRKHETMEEAPVQNLPRQAVESDTHDAKCLKKGLKKERKRAAREKRKLHLKTQKSIKRSDNQVKNQLRAMLPPQSGSNEETLVELRAAQKRTKSNFGPTASAYFAKPEILVQTSNPDPSITDGNSFTTSHAIKRARKRQRVPSRVKASLTSAASVKIPLEAVESAEQAEPVLDNAARQHAARLTVVQEDELAQADFGHSHELDASNPEVTNRKCKRKNKRNRNHLPEQLRSAKNSLDGNATVIQKEIVEFYAGEDEEPQGASEFYQNSEHNVKPPQKRNRRGERPPSPIGSVLLEKSHQSLEVPHETQSLAKYNNSETSDKPFDPFFMQEQEASQRPVKKQRRDRGRKSRSERRKDVTIQGDNGAITRAGQTVVEPLTEMVNTNANPSKEFRLERGRERKRKQDVDSEVGQECWPSGEHSKGYHS